MLYIDTKSLDPTWNLACEEYAFKELSHLGPIMMLWQNDNTVVVGRYQNTNAEINIEKALEKSVKVVRRITGGGTVYHDLGNINYSFILPFEKEEDKSLMYLSKPLIKALDIIGVKAKVNGRNDITIDDKKISGTAMSIYKNTILHHGTLLFDSNLNFLSQVLKVDRSKLESKGIKSVKSRVTNIKENIEIDYNTEEFKHILLSILNKDLDFIRYSFTDEDLINIKNIQSSKYKTKEWTFGRDNDFNYKKNTRHAGGNIDIRLNIEDNIIKECDIYGDFLGTGDLDDIINILIDSPYNKEEIDKSLGNIDIGYYFGTITKKELIESII